MVSYGKASGAVPPFSLSDCNPAILFHAAAGGVGLIDARPALWACAPRVLRE
jgi:hypothetical protein